MGDGNKVRHWLRGNKSSHRVKSPSPLLGVPPEQLGEAHVRVSRERGLENQFWHLRVHRLVRVEHPD